MAKAVVDYYAQSADVFYEEGKVEGKIEEKFDIAISAKKTWTIYRCNK
jgi:hypothetical protein